MTKAGRNKLTSQDIIDTIKNMDIPGLYEYVKTASDELREEKEEKKRRKEKTAAQSEKTKTTAHDSEESYRSEVMQVPDIEQGHNNTTTNIEDMGSMAKISDHSGTTATDVEEITGDDSDE